MHREPDPDGPDTPDDRLTPDPPLDAFDAIVAAWRADGDVPRWPDELDDPGTDAPEPGDPRLEISRPQAAQPELAQPDEVDLEVERLVAPLFDPAAAPPVHRPAKAAEEDDHFVPPEPPPLPRIGPPALVGITLIVLGLILIASPGWVGVPTPYGVPLGLVSIASGLGWLVLRLWPDHSDDGLDRYPDDDDDGAIL